MRVWIARSIGRSRPAGSTRTRDDGLLDASADDQIVQPLQVVELGAAAVPGPDRDPGAGGEVAGDALPHRAAGAEDRDGGSATAVQAAAFWPSCTPSAISSTTLAQKAGRSSGLRLLTSPSSTWTSSSTHSAPALRRSVRRLGQEVRVRPRTTSASTSVQGPWQMTPHRLARLEEGTDELDRLGFGPQLVGVGDAARQDQGVVLAAVGVADRPVDAEAVALVEVVEGLYLTRFGCQQVGLGAGFAHRFQRFLQLDLLDALVGDQEGHPFALQL